MATFGLGAEGVRVYQTLRDRIVRGDLTPGAKLPSPAQLSAEFGVGPIAIRQVLARLEAQGLLSRELGRGALVGARAKPSVLIVEDEPAARAVLSELATLAGCRAIAAAGPTEGLAALERDPAIALVLSDVRMPAPSDGLGFIRAVRRRWPELPLAVVTGYPADLAELQGTPECPVLVVPKPCRAEQVQEALRLALAPLATIPEERPLPGWWPPLQPGLQAADDG